MADTLNAELASGQIINFMLILLRVSVLVSMLPVFSGSQLPVQFKIGLVVFIALILTPVVNFQISENQIPLIIVKEILIGMALGYAARFVFNAVNMAGVFISFAVGMSMGRVFNPEMGSTTHLAEILGSMVMLMFLALDAHHDLIYVVVQSFKILPAGSINVLPLVPEMISIGAGLFVLSIKLAAPVMLGIFLAQVLTGFLYKAAPQMNIFFITMPLNIFLGFSIIIISLPVMENVIGINFSNMREDLIRLMMMAKVS
ncbi:MAG: flagellar biosynthetic protein FliR [Nitrospira sp.]|nr:flagellar biosynthetic protein FliR [bacterium]MBL7048056.1 flagellar biosynthetic protein FliR [Nitrospira sp.]